MSPKIIKKPTEGLKQNKATTRTRHKIKSRLDLFPMIYPCAHPKPMILWITSVTSTI